jgi:predicted nucleotidyltransferase
MKGMASGAGLDAARLPDPIEQLGVPRATARVLRYFLLRPGHWQHARELRRTLELGGASLERELGRLVSLGALERREEGRRVLYGAVAGSAVWSAVGILEARSADAATLVCDALADVAGVQAAFVFGSFGKGTHTVESDIDLFVVEEEEVDRKKLLRRLGELELLLDREINAVRYTQQSLAERLGSPRHPAWRFVRDALTGPKRWVAGGPSAIAPIAAAAGIRLSELSGSTS